MNASPLIRTSWGGAVLVFSSSAALLLVAVPLAASIHQAHTGDGADYVRMAQHPGAFPEAPEAFRILTPWLVSVLPFSVVVGFEVVTALALALTAALLFAWLRTLVALDAAVLGVILFLASGAVSGLARNPYLVDPLAFVFVVLAFLLLFRGSLGPLAAVLSIGILAKETVLFVIVAAVAVARRADRRLLAALIVGPLLVYVAIHQTPVIYRHRGHHSYLADIRGVYRYERQQIGVVRAPVQAVLYSFGPLWVAAICAWPRALGAVKRASAYVVPVAASVVIAADWPRVLGFAFPVVIALAVLLPLSRARRAALALATLLDTTVFEALPASTVKEALLAVSFAGGCIAACWRSQLRAM